ncbi:hypothetical protein [Telmatospirillum siberiense]|uniref:Type IV secretion protein IcmD n=1 Tax=Telmatospirillum siberiense TaxID=382514 RepID=A0A2N3PNM6_9PROT|nr:hypothetical protein [Telmatospirillum siberiense]PKU22002.1 hypothetical protein CWS72_24160 [Telmatospirillum siberiense]
MINKLNRSRVIALATSLLFVASDAFATSDLSTLATSWKTTASNLSDTVGAVVFLLGIGTGLVAGLKFKSHGEDPRQTPLKTCLIYALAAAALVGLPTFLGVGVQSLFGTSTNLTSTSGLSSVQ